MDDQGIARLQDEGEWDFDAAERQQPVRGRRTVVSVGFRPREFAQVAEAARKRDQPLSQFIREAAVDRAKGHQTHAERATGRVYTIKSPTDMGNLLTVLLVPWIAGLGAILGHLFPVWLGFKGGKGIATYIGVLLGAYWPAALIFCLTWLAVAVVTRFSSLSSLVGTFVVFIYFTIVGGQLVVPIVAIISALIFWKHRENIRRLLAGQESRIGAKA